MIWIQIYHPDMIIANGKSRQIGFRGQREFAYFLRKISSVDDEAVPRVVCAIGPSKDSAEEQARDEVMTYDQAPDIIWAWDERHPACKAHSTSPFTEPTT